MTTQRTTYALLERSEWSGSGLGPVHAEDGCEIVLDNELAGAVEARTGRSYLLANRNVRRRLDEHGRVYIAAHGRRGGVVIENLRRVAGN